MKIEPFVCVAAFCVTLLSFPSFAAELSAVNGKPIHLSDNAFTAAVVLSPHAITQIQSGPPAGLVCSVGSGYYDGFRLRIEPSGWGFIPSVEIGRGQKKSPAFLEARKTRLPAGFPSHFAVTWDGAKICLYMNGTLVAEKPHTGDYVQGKKGLGFCAGHAAYGLSYYPFDGSPIRVWDTALTSSEVAGLAAKVKGIPSDEEIQAFVSLSESVLARRLSDGTLDARFTPLAEHLLFDGVRRGVDLDLPEPIFERFAASLGTNDTRRLSALELSRIRNLERSGKTEQACVRRENVWKTARDNDCPYAALAGLAYAKALERHGRSAAAAAVRKEAVQKARPYLRKEVAGSASVASASPAKQPDTSSPAISFFVAPNGSDAGDGSLAHPFATLMRARDAVRTLKAKGSLPKGGVSVNLRGGIYPVHETFELTSADSGEPGAPIVWRAFADERPVLFGGLKITEWKRPDVNDPAAARLSPPARQHVVCIDLRKAGFTDFLPRASYGYHHGENEPGAALTDVYCDGKRLMLARDPNAGWLRTLTVPDSKTNHVFTAELTNAVAWAKEPDLMATGYWCHFWADMTSAVSVDPASGALSLGKRRGVPEVKKDHPFFLLNALHALDTPGEWFLDRHTGLLYLWPPHGNTAAHTWIVSFFSDPFMTLRNVSHFALEGIVFEYGRRSAVEARGCTSFTFAGNTVRNFGENGLMCVQARNCTIRENVFRGFGYGAMRVSGGNRKKLISGGISITGNDISDCERWKRTYAPGLLLEGCGTEVSYNHFHDILSSAMRIEGNDHCVRSNIVERVVTESDDQGGIDIYANPSYAGILIEHNLWRNIGSGGENAPCGQAGVRFDDAVSSMVVYGNRFENCSFGNFGAVQMNGGRNNTVDNNVFVGCRFGVSIGRWPQKRWEEYFQRPHVITWISKDVNIFGPLYSEKYPGITGLPDMKLVNYLTRNVFVGEGLLSAYPPPTVTFANRAFATMPTAAKLAEEPAFTPLPPEQALGPRQTKAFCRARVNDRL